MIAINLDPNQIGLATIVLTDAQLAAIHAQENAPPNVPPAPPSGPVAPFVAPPAVAGRALMKTEASWQNGPSHYSPFPLTDSNAWLFAFTVDRDAYGQIAAGEYQGPATLRNWAVVRNRDGVVVAASARSVQGPSFQFGSPRTPFDKRTRLDVGERYTFAIWNATPGQSSRMVAQIYL